jgi:hypothetical protein
MRYGAASWHRPYGGEEGLGFGQGDGAVSGELEGTVTWGQSLPSRLSPAFTFTPKGLDPRSRIEPAPSLPSGTSVERSLAVSAPEL